MEEDSDNDIYLQGFRQDSNFTVLQKWFPEPMLL